MSEDEDCDDLPMISVNSSANDSSVFAMPSADVVASQRARERECEEELQRLREACDAGEGGEGGAGGAGLLARSDSSGSEAEAALAAGVQALRVPPPRAAPPPLAHLAAALLPHLAPHPPHSPHSALLHALAAAHARAAAALLHHLVESVSASLCADSEWCPDELLCVCALLCVCVVAREGGRRRDAARALHALLDERADATQTAALRRVLTAAWSALAPADWLPLCDALRSGAGAGADTLAHELAADALSQALAPGGAWSEAAAWRRLPAGAQYGALQLAGRVLRAAPASRRALLLHALRLPPAHPNHHQRPDTLKVLVGASRLKLLFHTDQ